MPAEGLLLSWNVAGRVRERQEAQLAALAHQDFDVLCLQEITPTTGARWLEALTARGLHVALSEWPPAPRAPTRRLATLIASRSPLDVRGRLGIPWPERHLAARTLLGEIACEVHCLHAPTSQKGEQVKVRTLEAVAAALAAASDVPRIVAGDFNTPRYESREGEIVTFARTSTGRLRPDYGERHDRAELALIEALPRAGWSDAFRALHGYGRRDRSWKGYHAGPGYRLDHIVLSPGLRALACDYLHEWRERRLSDHSPMWARIAPAPARADACA